jgi:hypothetical protein
MVKFEVNAYGKDLTIEAYYYEAEAQTFDYPGSSAILDIERIFSGGEDLTEIILDFIPDSQNVLEELIFEKYEL